MNNYSRRQQVQLTASAADPDGNQLSIQWWQYMEAGTYPKNVKIQNANSLNAGLVMPADAVSGQTIHVILQVKMALSTFRGSVVG